ncbi:MAG: phosphopantothenoylcysteine decarboxylase / phosphopantothenate---cysteine ligase, partial [Thermoleophilaceae bacterium]|nr:phosphopantothenoylcysteine decarboxylase / phosphopantothenate---cysteine ligase [Thermoleophilaceae bacterium]
FRPASPAANKISKEDHDGLTVEMKPTADVLTELAAARRPGQVVVGFAAEHGEGAVERARRKLEAKRLDAIVANDISRPDIGFDVGDNEVTIVTADAELPVPLGSKAEVAGAVLDLVERLRAGVGAAQRS